MWRTKEVKPPHMVLHRYWRCLHCKGERGFGEVRARPVKAQKWRGHEAVTREMTAPELKDFEAKQAKEAAKYTGKAPKTYGVKDDGQPIYRNEYKQAERKRLTRKREDD